MHDYSPVIIPLTNENLKGALALIVMHKLVHAPALKAPSSLTFLRPQISDLSLAAYIAYTPNDQVDKLVNAKGIPRFNESSSSKSFAHHTGAHPLCSSADSERRPRLPCISLLNTYQQHLASSYMSVSDQESNTCSEHWRASYFREEAAIVGVMIAGDSQSFDIIMITIGILRTLVSSHRKHSIHYYVPSNNRFKHKHRSKSVSEDRTKNIQDTDMRQHNTLASSYISQLESTYSRTVLFRKHTILLVHTVVCQDVKKNTKIMDHSKVDLDPQNSPTPPPSHKKKSRPVDFVCQRDKEIGDRKTKVLDNRARRGDMFKTRSEPLRCCPGSRKPEWQRQHN